MANEVKITTGKAPALPKAAKPTVGGTVPSPDTFRETAKGKAFILTAAQNNTKVHTKLWNNLVALAKKRKAQIMVSRITYNKNGFQNATKDAVSSGDEEMWFDERVLPYVQDHQIKLAPGLVFAAELDILPTAKDPLSGLDNYTGTNSMVVPHPKVHMRSYAGLLSGQEQRFGYTTGACTLRNYVDRRAGQIASYHHVYGALWVEVAADGTWFARQINADDDGSFFELDTFVENGKCQAARSDGVSRRFAATPERVLNLGDVHAEKMDAQSFKTAMALVSELDLTHVVIHDLLDFEARNHHNLKDPFFLAEQHFNGMNTVEKNFQHAAAILGEIARVSNGAKMIVVRSNHDQAFERWLREFDGKHDPANARFYHWHMFKSYTAIENGYPKYDPFWNALSTAAANLGVDYDEWVNVKEDDSYVIHGIELGLHGHLGPNGSRGSPKGYRQLGRKLNTGHTHSAGIIDGVWTAGVLASLSMGYNKGPSSWSHSHILTHPNGKRQMITCKGSRWRA
ncbi:hypothetical protein CPT_Palo_021 [Rhizobium phage Palo]|uniref:A1 protein n=1 Tax=Rhizobium phage Palo TaxID=2767573 RepID=A0A7L8G6H7_9CAUD|nr:hypothetical protein CPT_Palo_021 [Rhizobium phage Palo]